MNVTVYSFLSAVICFDIFILISRLFQRQINFFLGYNCYPVLVMMVLSLLRMFAPVELEHVRIIRDHTVLPMVQTALQAEISKSGMSVSVLLVLSAFVLAVSAALLARLMLTVYTDWQILKEYEAVADERIHSIMASVAEDDKKKYQILMVKRKTSPSVWSLWKSFIIIPETLAEMSDRQIYYIFTHEWQHVKQRDCWYKLLVNVLCCLMWWNPVVYMLKEDIKQTLELRCDLNVTRNMTPAQRHEYVITLLQTSLLEVRGAAENRRRLSQSLCIEFTGAFVKTYEEYQECKAYLESEEAYWKQDREKTHVKIAKPSGVCCSFIEMPVIRTQSPLRRKAGYLVWKIYQRTDLIKHFHKRNHAIGVCCTVLGALLFALSFQFVVQPYVTPSMQKMMESNMSEATVTQISALTPDNAYILYRQDGIYALYINGRYARNLSLDELKNATHRDLPIMSEF